MIKALPIFWLPAIFSMSGFAHAQNQQDQTFSAAHSDGNQICAIRTSGELVCRVESTLTRLLPPNNLPQLVSVTTGAFHACGLTLLGQVHCWGDNDFGQTDSPTETVFDAVEAGPYHTCGIDLEGQVQCWGRNDFGESVPQFFESNYDMFGSVAVNTDFDSSGHPSVSQPSPIVSLDLTLFGSCGLDTQNIIRCWGLTNTNFDPNRLAGNKSTVIDFATSSENGITISQVALMQDGSTRSRTGYERLNDFGQSYRQLVGLDDEICGLRFDGVVVCHERFQATGRVNRAELLAELNTGEPLQSIVGGSAGMCGLTAGQSLRCLTIFSDITVPGVEPTAAPQDVVTDGDSIINNLNSNNLSNGIDSSANGVSVIGQTISWPDDGWYQVQNAADFTEVCGGGTSCDVGPGTYVVINHTSGRRTVDVVVGGDVGIADNSGDAAFDGTSSGGDTSGIKVSGNTISWPDDGWYQVQNEVDFAEVCGGGTSCDVSPGTYLVINHTLGVRVGGIVVR